MVFWERCLRITRRWPTVWRRVELCLGSEKGPWEKHHCKTASNKDSGPPDLLVCITDANDLR